MEDNKPQETDETQEEQTEGTQSETQKESGQRDVDSIEGLSVEQLQEMSGRKDINTIDDFKKHYTNMKSMVGDQEIAELRKKAEQTEATKSEKSDLEERLARLEQTKEVDDFTSKYPDAKNTLDHIQSLAKDKGCSLEEAWEGKTADGKEFLGVKELAESYNAKQNESDDTVKSKNRISSAQSTKTAELEKRASQGDLAAQEELAGLLG